ncbi:MAG: TatD family hydrolase [Clostridia bacterium]|nr:TatD family hydrolase [Clostridia bacterium]
MKDLYELKTNNDGPCFFDTHAHYTDSAFDEDRDEMIARCRDAGMIGAVNCGTDYESSLECVRLAEKYDFLYAAAGIHPEEALKYSPEEMDKIRALLSHPKVAAVGETGLDYFYQDGAPREVQKDNFIANIKLALAYGKPVIVHDREAHADTMDILKQENVPEGKAVFHCYSGSAEMAKEIVKRGWLISFGGALTFKNAKRAAEAAAAVPLELLMLETDCPYMAPEPFRGTRNVSANIPYVARKLAEIKDVGMSEVMSVTTANAFRFFGIEKT